MVFRPTRGDAPARNGPGVPQLPGIEGSVLDASVYTDPVRFELERERVLNRSWLVAARSSELPDTGDFVRFESHGETIVVTRQPDGSCAAFHNVCSHRGPRIVSADCGSGARRFTCPYHGWVYDTTGKLVGVPEREDFCEAHLAAANAKSVAVDEWAGWVFVNFAGDAAPPLLDWIGPEIVEDLGRFRMEDMIVHEKLVFDVPVSYKAIVDGFNEVYHSTQLHQVPPPFTKAARAASFFVAGNNGMMFVPRPDALEQLAETGDHHQYTICHYTVFPNTVFNNNPDQIQCFNPIPIDVDRTRFICWELVYPHDPENPEDQKYWTAAMAHWEILKYIVGQDIGIYQELAATKRSSGYTQNIFSQRECKLTHYHQVMDEMIRDPR